MAAIQNDRDLLLQAASVRLVPLPIDDIANAVRGVTLTATSTQFKVPVSGSPTPSSITFTAKRVLLSGAVSWSVVAGTATLTGSGATTRTLTPGNMGTQSATIRATVVEGGSTYTDDITIVKVIDGNSGTDGSRGTVMLSTTIASGSWSDAAANALILSATGSSDRVIGDLVTLVNTSNSSSQSRRWNGSAWIVQDRFLGGNLLVGGNIGGQTFTGGVFEGGILRGSSEISLVNGGNMTWFGPGSSGTRALKWFYDGFAGVLNTDITAYWWARTYLALAEISTLELSGSLSGPVGNQVLMNGRKFWVNIGGTGAVEMEIGVRIS